jgi:SAM-dependent methyltransferase
VLDLGCSPLADVLTDQHANGADDQMVPLNLAWCEACGLLQIAETVSPEILFSSQYPYLSSTSDSWLDHCRKNAIELINQLGLDQNSLVIEPASNDGYMLQNFVSRGIPVLGIEPSRVPSLQAEAAGVPTLEAFFNRDLAVQLASEGRLADLIIANNVLAHVMDLHDFMAGLVILLKPQGTLVIEVPYVEDLIAKNAFDTIYHQHLCYFGINSLDTLMRQHNIKIIDVKQLTTHGGSLRIYARRYGDAQPIVAEMKTHEQRQGGMNWDYYAQFVTRVDLVRDELVSLLKGIKSDGFRIAAYGAAAKGTTLMHYCEIGKNYLDYVVDRNEFKQGKRMPGNALEILSPEFLLTDKPDYLLLLPWNLAEEILSQLRNYQIGGGRVIVPLPSLWITDFQE